MGKCNCIPLNLKKVSSLTHYSFIRYAPQSRPWRENISTHTNNMYGQLIAHPKKYNTRRGNKYKSTSNIKRDVLKEKLISHVNMINVDDYLSPTQRVKSRRRRSSTVHIENYRRLIKTPAIDVEEYKQRKALLDSKDYGEEIDEEDSQHSVKMALFPQKIKNIDKVALERAARKKKKTRKPLTFTQVHAIKNALEKQNEGKINAKSKPYNISHIAAGNSFSCCVSGKGKLYTWGKNNFGHNTTIRKSKHGIREHGDSDFSSLT